MILANSEQGRLEFTTSLEQAVEHAEVLFIAQAPSWEGLEAWADEIGIPPEVARDTCMVGCIETMLAGRQPRVGRLADRHRRRDEGQRVSRAQRGDRAPLDLDGPRPIAGHFVRQGQRVEQGDERFAALDLLFYRHRVDRLSELGIRTL